MMRILLALSLGVACCSLWVGAEVPLQPDFQNEKVLGKWYGIGLASNSNWFKDRKSHMKMCTTIITPTTDGNMDVTATYPKMDRCETKSMTYFKTEQPGRFRAKSPRYGSEHDMRVVETNYDEYILMYTVKTKGSETNQIVSLFGKFSFPFWLFGPKKKLKQRVMGKGGIAIQSNCYTILCSEIKY
ncbi:hypothetical protein XELAEV_18041453mg [Xenopus laevis]|uniref:Lipocalin/cytosolic fatty-acid binding domain-containing protein n=1 Tax=Xenopus laevis TaxID=8355 RepID=A0A974C2A1_XENLA|nr:hypothetical protein XELAEV_18041453mg [Xenopus laevis]